MIAIRRTAAALAAAALLGSIVLAPGLPAGAASSDPVSSTVTATRTYLDADGTSHTVDTKKVKLSVSTTTNLRGRQELTVNWSGAHPTGGLVADVNSASGGNQEYPFVLLECRGVDSSSAKNRLSPETCWTQTWSERFTSDNTPPAYPPWRADRYATAGDRKNVVDAPKPRPAKCFNATLAERWVPFFAADGTTYSGGSVGCAGMAPESANVDSGGIPSNTTYGITGTDGTGSAQFDVWTSDENASLGCTSTVPCSLVAVPIMGVSCDAYGTQVPASERPSADDGPGIDTSCRAPDAYRPGEVADAGIKPNPAVTGALWWSASNWRNRITVPLSFATPASICSVVGTSSPLAIYGSVLMNEATAQWQPKFCTDKSLFPFVHVQTADSAARTLLAQNNIDMAFSSQAPPGGFTTRPVVQAPIAMSGFAVTYAIDDAKGNRYTSLRLNARLIAKLLTQSYPANTLVRNNYPALANNPMNITQDPEFVELNPGLPSYDSTEAAATLLTLSTEADLMWSLSSYLNADPSARAWLNGTPDQWGMVVNPNYKSIALPLESWPLLDSFMLPKSYIDGGNNPCYSYSPSPYLALIANPTAFISTIVQDIQFAISNVDIGCPNGDPSDVSTLRLSPQGRQQPGFRFVLGVAPISAAHRYNLLTAALQTSPGTFVSADDAGLRAAGAILRPHAAAKTWSLDYADLQTSTGSAAYPGAMPVFADAPTTGLTKANANRVATLLRYAATTGQHSGLANGELPPGYLPLTAANGLSALSAYTARAADAVAAQTGDVPALKAPPVAPPTKTTTTTTTGSHHHRSTSSASMSAAAPPSVPVVPVVTAGSATPSVPVSSPAVASTTPSAAPAPASTTPSTLAVRTVGVTSSLGKWTLPGLILIGLLAALLGAGLRYPQAFPTGAAMAIRFVRRRWPRSGSHR